MCRALNISRGMIYYTPKENQVDVELESEVISIHKASRNHYGTRKIKRELAKKGHQVSRRKIGKVMKKYGLVSTYTKKQYKVHSPKCNEDKIANVVNRKFDKEEALDVVVSDLTYVNVKGKWNYICLIIDLFNREFVGYAAGKKKNAELITEAFKNIKRPMDQINILHTDRGNEFKNKAIDNILDRFDIERSLSNKGCPYDNAVTESTGHWIT